MGKWTTPKTKTMTMTGVKRVTAYWFPAALCVAGGSRLWAVITYPVPEFPDSQGYLFYAQRILTDPTIWHRMGPEPLEITGLRTIGYPVLLALAQWLAGGAGLVLVQILQCAVFVLACALLFRAGSALVRSEMAAFFAVVGTALGYGITYDLAILPDSLGISAWIALAALGSLLVQGSRRGGLGPFLVCGMLLLGMTALRGNGMHMGLLLLPLILLAVWRRMPSWSGRIVALAGFLLPAFLFQASVMQWNHYRTGEHFYSSGGVLALMQPVQRMQARDPAVVEGPGELRALMRELNPRGEYAPLYDVAREMASRHNMNAPAIQSAAVTVLKETILEHPAAFARVFLRNFDDKFAQGLINPALGLNEAHFLLTDRREFPGFSRLVKGQAEGLIDWVYVILYGLGIAISLALFLGALTLPVLLLWRWRDGVDGIRATLVLCLWLAVMGGLAYYCALFMELRYVAMFQPWTILLGCIALRFWRAHERWV